MSEKKATKPAKEAAPATHIATTTEPAPEKKAYGPNDIRPYYKYKVREQHDEVVDVRRQERLRVLKGYERVGECLQVTHISEAIARTLNAQTPMSEVYYYAEGEESFLPATNFF